MQANWRIYPSLLNTFSDYENYEVLYDKFYGTKDDPPVSLEEFRDKQEKKLLDTINRVEGEPIEAADRGTCLNEIIDCILEHRKPAKPISLQTIRDPDGHPQSILAKLHGFAFNFDAALCMDLAAYFRGSTCQHLCEAVITTSRGPALLYGYSDYIRRDVVYDLKTTGRYDYGKYDDGFQKDLYPWCLIESGELETVSGFEYTAVKLTGGTPTEPLLKGEIFKEWHDYSHSLATDRLRDACESLIWWVDTHRDLITNERIFNK